MPSELGELIVAATKGGESLASEDPTLEMRVMGFLKELEEASLDEEGFLLRKARWPGGARYAACLTHDVDNISRPRSHIIAVRERFSTPDLLLALLGLKSLYNNIVYTASMEERRRLRSSFYLLSSGYDLEGIADTLRELQGLGWEIGLHGDFGTHDTHDNMAAAVARFKSQTRIEPRGLREHFLRFDYEKSWGIMDSLGFDYDTSVGNRDKLGFRLGLCAPFHPPGPDWKPRRLLELPLVLMDTTLWGYLKRTEEEGIRDFASLKEKVEGVEGLFTILWHQEAMRMKGGRIYPRLLDLLVADGCFAGSGAAITRWWLGRSRPMTLRGSEFAMEGSPDGLRLVFKAKEERKLSLDGGRMEIKSTGTTIDAPAGGFRLKVE